MSEAAALAPYCLLPTHTQFLLLHFLRFSALLFLMPFIQQAQEPIWLGTRINMTKNTRFHLIYTYVNNQIHILLYRIISQPFRLGQENFYFWVSSAAPCTLGKYTLTHIHTRTQSQRPQAATTPNRRRCHCCCSCLSSQLQISRIIFIIYSNLLLQQISIFTCFKPKLYTNFIDNSD